MTTTEGVNNVGNEQDTGTPENTTETQAETRTFTQDEVDKIVQGRLEKYKKRYSDVDMNEYKSLKQEAEEREMEAMKKRQEFDKILEQQKTKYSSEIETLRNELTSMKVDGTLLNAASSRNAVNPEQVAQLLRNSVGLDETGRPVVFDKDGSVVYTDEGTPKSLDAYVNEFLDNNSHFLRSGPSGVNSKGQTGSSLSKSEVDLGSIDLTKPEGRELYRKLKAEGKI